MKTLSILVPVYCNEGTLPKLFQELYNIESMLNKMDVSLELVFVDDGSLDGSFELLEKFKRKRSETKVIKLSRNFGAISAVKVGLNYISGDCFMFLAADLQDPPNLIPQMASKWLGGAKYVICERTSRDDPIISKMFSFVYYKLLKLLVVDNYPAKGFDLALMDKVFLSYLKDSGKHINIPLFPYLLGFKPEKIHYARESRVSGKSKWTFRKKLKLLVDSILPNSFVPIRLLSLIGLLISTGSFLYGFLIVVSALVGQVPIPGFSTIVSLISFLLGIIIIMLGIISEYIWRIFDEVNRHPYAVIEKVL